jgi:ABC-2 type transport system permease protein
MLSSIIQEDTLNYFTPFRYFEAYYIIGHTGYKASFVILSIALVAVLTAASYVIYSKKDIHAV